MNIRITSESGSTIPEDTINKIYGIIAESDCPNESLTSIPGFVKLEKTEQGYTVTMS